MASDGDSARSDAQSIDAILDKARAARKRPSRAMWIAAALVGVGCAVAFIIVLVADGEPSTTPRPAQASSWGFGAGVVAGLVAGIAIGFSLARQRHSSRNRP